MEKHPEEMAPGKVQVKDQWTDFLIRRVDPYARAKYQIVLDWLGNLKDKEVLVIGSGSGELAAMLAARGARVLATDIDEPSVEFTRKTLAYFGVRAQTEVHSVESIPDTKKYDVVVATDVLEHIKEHTAAAKKIVTLTRSHGRLVITVPALQSLFGYHDEILGHYRRYTKQTLLEIFAGLAEPLCCRYYGFWLIPVALVISRWLRRPYPLGQVGSFSEKGSFFARMVSFAFSWERKVPLPFGTSLLMLAEPIR